MTQLIRFVKFLSAINCQIARCFYMAEATVAFSAGLTAFHRFALHLYKIFIRMA
ncbi:MAG: hypothetical protein ACI832_001853 [Rheinheimera aquimaris]|jgi:hypothetical protein